MYVRRYIIAQKSFQAKVGLIVCKYFAGFGPCPQERVDPTLSIEQFLSWPQPKYSILPFLHCYVQGSPKKHETWKTTWELLPVILERIKGPSIKTNMPKLYVKLIEFY